MNTDIASFDPASPILRFLAKSGIDRYKKKKRNKILKSIEAGSLSVNSHEAESEEFISAYLATENALMVASSKSKFKFLVGLFVNSANTGKLAEDPDGYMEMLSIINELSERELALLYHIYVYERDNGIMDGQLARSSDHQVQYIVERTSIDKNLVIALLVRLRRTGLLITLSEKTGHSDLMMTGVEIFCISPLAEEVKQWVYGVIEGVFQIEP